MRELQLERGDLFYLSSDQLHPNDRGHRCMAEQLARAIVGGLMQAGAEQSEGAMKWILLVTWFFSAGMPPPSRETEFDSAEACYAAKAEIDAKMQRARERAAKDPTGFKFSHMEKNHVAPYAIASCFSK
jgi:hypothetical protein